MVGCGSRHRPAVRTSELDAGPEAEDQVEAAATPVRTARREQPAEPAAGEVNLGSLRLTAPEGWLRERPAVSFILAEFRLRCVEGDAADGRLTVSQVGGSVAENVNRWRGQFGGKPQKESQDRVEIAGIEVTVVDFSGTYLDQRGPMAPAIERPEYRLLGAILPIDDQLYFIKCYGPQKTMAEHGDRFEAFVRSLRPGPPAG